MLGEDALNDAMQGAISLRYSTQRHESFDDTSRGNGNVLTRFVPMYEPEITWYPYVRDAGKLSGAMHTNIDVPLSEALYFPLKLMEVDSTVFDPVGATVEGDKLFRYAVDICMKDREFLERLEELNGLNCRRKFWSNISYSTRGVTLRGIESGLSSQATSSGVELFDVEIASVSSMRFLCIGDRHGVRQTTLTESEDIVSRYLLAWSVSATSAFYDFMVKCLDSVDSGKPMAVFGTELYAYSYLYSKPYRQDWMTCNVQEMIGDFEAAAKACTKICKYTTRLSKTTRFKWGDIYPNTWVSRMVYVKNGSLVPCVQEYQSCSIIRYLANAYPWIINEIRRTESENDEKAKAVDFTPKHGFTDKIVLWTHLNNRRSGASMDRINGLMELVHRHQIGEKYRNSGFPEDAISFSVSDINRINVPAFMCVDSVGFECVLVPTSAKTAGVMRKMYGIPERDKLLHVPSSDDSFVNPAYEYFVREFERRFELCFVGKVNILDYLESTSGHREIGEESVQDNVFYMFIRKESQ